MRRSVFAAFVRPRPAPVGLSPCGLIAFRDGILRLTGRRGGFTATRQRLCVVRKYRPLLLLLRPLLNDALLRPFPSVDSKVREDAEDHEESGQHPRGLLENVRRLTSPEDLLRRPAGGYSGQTATLPALKQYDERDEDRNDRDEYDEKRKHNQAGLIEIERMYAS